MHQHVFTLGNVALQLGPVA